MHMGESKRPDTIAPWMGITGSGVLGLAMGAGFGPVSAVLGGILGAAFGWLLVKSDQARDSSR